MNNNISSVVRKTLSERYEIENKFNLILENEEMSDKEKFDKIADTLADLEDAGKSPEEIDGHISEGLGDWIMNYIKPGADETSDKDGINPGVGDFAKKGGSAFSSQVREYLISYGLRLLGFRGKLKEAFATAMADLDLRNLVAMFRGGQNCTSYGPAVMDAFTEGVARYFMHDIEEKSYVGGALRNFAFEYFKASDLGEKMAEVVCKAIPKR